MKKILSYVFLVCLTLCVFVSCRSVNAEDLIQTLLVEQDSYVDSDFYVVGEMKSGEEIYPITWESDNACLSVSETKNETGYYTVKVTRPDNEAQTVNLTATLTVSKKNTATKTFEFRVYPVDVYDLLDSFVFEHKGVKVEMGTSIDLPLETEHLGKKASIVWSTENTDVVTLNEAGNQATFATVVKDTPIVLTATFTYNGQSTSMNYNLTVAPYATEFEKLKEWYENEGITQVLSGYVLEIATVYSEQYNNVSLYISNEDFTGGYYLYRVGMDPAEAAQLKVGAHVTATGTVNTSYSGLMETNKGGNLVVDEDVTPIDVTTKYYAIDNDLIANVPSLYYRESTLVSLSNWKVKEINKEFNDGSTKWILKLEKDGVETTVCYSNYIASTPMPNKNGGEESQAYKDVVAKLNTLAAGNYVNISGLLSYYNQDRTKYDQASYQIYVQSANSITKIDNGSDVANTDGKKMAAAIEAIEGFKPAYTSNTVIQLPTTAGEATVAWDFHNKYHTGAELNEAKNVLTIAPTGYSIVSLNATLTVGEYSTKLYFSFVLEQLSDEEIVDRVLEDIEIEEQYASGEVELSTTHDLFATATISYALKETTYTSVTLTDNVLTVNNLSLTQDETVVIIATVTVGEVVKTKEITVLIHVLAPSTVAEFLEAKNDKTPTLLQGVVTAVNGVDPEKGDSFVLTDAEGTSVFCYDKSLVLTLGDEIQLLAYYGENSGFPQITKPVLVKTISKENDVTTKSGTKVEKTAADIAASIAEQGVTESKLYKTYGAQYLAIRGYVVLSGSYTYLATDANGTGCVSLYANKGLNASSYVGGEVIVYGFARGCSLNGKYLTIQVQSINMIENDANKVSVELSAVKLEPQYDAGEVTLPATGTKYNNVALTYTVKSGAENATITGNKLTLVAGEDNATVVITVTATLGEEKASKDITLVVKGTAAVEVISTVAEFLAAKNTTTATLLKGVITAVNKVGENGAFVLTDAEGTSIFCYSGLNVKLGDEIKLSAVYSENAGFPQIGTPELIETISEGNDVTTKSGTKVEINASDVVAKLTEAGMTNEKMYETYGEQYLAIKGYVVASGSYANLSATKGGTSCVNLFANSGLNASSYVGKEVIVYGFARGANLNSKYLSLQVQAIEEVTSTEPEEPETPVEPEEPTLVAKTVAEFLAAKDADNAVILQGVITAVNKVGSAGSFVLTDAEGTSVFCYTSIEVTLGDEVKLSAKYSENQGFSQIGSPEVLEVVSTGNDVAAKSGTKVELNATDIAAKLAEEGMSNEKMYELYGTSYLAIKGYVIASGNYANLSTTVDGSSCVNLYANPTLNSASYIGKEVIIYGFARGANVGSKYLTVQVQAIEEVIATEPEEPETPVDPEPEQPGEPEIIETTIAELVATAPTETKKQIYVVEGVWTAKDGLLPAANTYGNGILSDGEGNSIVVYGLSSSKDACITFADGTYVYTNAKNFPTLDIYDGATLKVGMLYDTQYKNYLTYLIEDKTTNEDKADNILQSLLLKIKEKYTQNAFVELKSNSSNFMVEVTIQDDAQTVKWDATNNKLEIMPTNIEITENLTIKVIVGDASAEDIVTITTKTEETTTTWSQNWSSLVSGTYTIYLGAEHSSVRYVAENKLTSNKFVTAKFDEDTNLSNNELTIIVDKENQKVQIKIGTQYLAYDSKTNFKLQTTAFNWSIGTNGTDEYLYDTTSNRALLLNSQGNKIAPYAMSNAGTKQYAYAQYYLVTK